MDNMYLFLLRLILALVLVGIVAAGKTTQTDIAQYTSVAMRSTNRTVKQDFYLKPILETSIHSPEIKRKKDNKIKKAKRDVHGQYRKSWSRSSNFGYGEYSTDLPLYLVFNRKVGAYYPFYKYPKEKNFRRNSYAQRAKQPIRPAM